MIRRTMPKDDPPSNDPPNVIRIEAFQTDGEPRALDSTVAARLGYADPKNFRALIKRHERYLKKLNILRTVRGIPDGVGRPGVEYWLTEMQTVYLIGKSDTPVASDVFVDIVRAFVEFKRTHFRTDKYGALVRELLLPAPREWEREYQESFWIKLHRVGGWRRPIGNNHSNCAHFINKFVYEYLLGALGLEALRDLNPANDDGERAHRHHQFLKEKHLPRLREHIKIVEGILSNSVSIRHFSDQFARWFNVTNIQLGILFEEENPNKAA